MKPASPVSGEQPSEHMATVICASAMRIRSRISRKPSPAYARFLRRGKKPRLMKRSSCSMTRIRLCLLLLICAALPVFSLPAQQNKTAEPGQSDSNSQILSVNVDLVNVIFTVADKSGKLITRLPKEDFKVFEDDKAQTLSNFSN